MSFRQGPNYKGRFSKIKSFEPQTNNRGQSLKYLEVGNDDIEWGMDWVGKAWQYGDQCKAIVGIEMRG